MTGAQDTDSGKVKGRERTERVHFYSVPELVVSDGDERSPFVGATSVVHVPPAPPPPPPPPMPMAKPSGVRRRRGRVEFKNHRASDDIAVDAQAGVAEMPPDLAAPARPSSPRHDPCPDVIAVPYLLVALVGILGLSMKEGKPVPDVHELRLRSFLERNMDPAAAIELADRMGLPPSEFIYTRADLHNVRAWPLEPPYLPVTTDDYSRGTTKRPFVVTYDDLVSDSVKIMQKYARVCMAPASHNLPVNMIVVATDCGNRAFYNITEVRLIGKVIPLLEHSLGGHETRPIQLADAVVMTHLGGVATITTPALAWCIQTYYQHLIAPNSD